MGGVHIGRVHRVLIAVVVAGAVVIAAIGFAGSFAAVRDLAEEKGFGAFAPFFPLGVDCGILTTLALDFLLTYLRIPFPLLRQTAWLLTAATIAFNGAAAWPDPLGVGMHAVIPVLFVVTVEAARHTMGRLADVATDRQMEGIRLSRWLLAFPSTFSMFRRMRMWELRSYDEAIRMEQDRLIYEMHLRAHFGRGWRRKAPVEALLPLKLARYGTPLTETAPAGLAAAGLPPDALTAVDRGPQPTESTDEVRPAGGGVARPRSRPELGTEEHVEQALVTRYEQRAVSAPRPQHSRPSPEPAQSAYLELHSGPAVDASPEPDADELPRPVAPAGPEGSGSGSGGVPVLGPPPETGPGRATDPRPEDEVVKAAPGAYESGAAREELTFPRDHDEQADSLTAQSGSRAEETAAARLRNEPTEPALPGEHSLPEAAPEPAPELPVAHQEPAALPPELAIAAAADPDLPMPPRPSPSAEPEGSRRDVVDRQVVPEPLQDTGPGPGPDPDQEVEADGEDQARDKEPDTEGQASGGGDQVPDAGEGPTLVDRYYEAWAQLTEQAGAEPDDLDELSQYLLERGMTGRGGAPVSVSTLRRYRLGWRIYRVWAEYLRETGSEPELGELEALCAKRGIKTRGKRGEPLTARDLAGYIEDLRRRHAALDVPLAH